MVLVSIPRSGYGVVLLLTLAVALFASGCLGSSSSGDGTTESRSAGLQGALPSFGGEAVAPSVPVSSVVASDQYVTKESSIRVKVPEGTLETRFEALKADLSARGAKTGDVRYYEYGDRREYVLTVRVSPAKFDSINDLLKETGEIKEMTVNVDDVTKQYMDLDTRIKNKEVELSRLLAIYNQTTNVSDLLAVEREVTRVETELELLRSEKQSLESRITLSTISIAIFEEKPAMDQFSLSLENVANMFFGAMAFGITLMVLAVGFLLPLAIVVGVLWLIYKALRGGKPARPGKPEHSRIPPPQ